MVVKQPVGKDLNFDLNTLFPFELDDFQKQAIAALNAGKSVVVCAPTGSGKTVIGEYAIYRALAQGKRVFYTTPLKALSNQKFRDFQEQFASEDWQKVGLITGDILINPEASVVVMTTEIFRNMLYETPIGQVGTSLEDVAVVVLDECHYLSDKSRGTVWEESIIYCPPQIQLLALSATIGKPEELTDWISRVRNAASKNNSQVGLISTCELIDSDFRPVPLQFYYSNNQGLFPLLNPKKDKINPNLKAQTKKSGERKRLRREDCPQIPQVVYQLQEKDMLPAIYIIFSRRGCDKAVEDLNGLNLVTQTQRELICLNLLNFFLFDNLELQDALLALLEENNLPLRTHLIDWLSHNPNSERELTQFFQAYPYIEKQIWQFLTMRSQIAKYNQVEALLRGIASHHAGLLPAWKELIEKLFELGLVKVVFATATLAAGINMPARSTVISALSKRTDDGHSMLTPSEFLQIAGRAGRRGKDTIGHVIIVQTPFEGAKEAAFLATSEAEPLRSWFTPSYGMVLNLLQKHSLEEAKNLLERSFAEYLAQIKLIPEQEAIAQLTTELTKLDVELAPIEPRLFASYEKIREHLKEEYRLLEILQQQAEAQTKRSIAPKIAQLIPGNIIHLKGKHLRVASPLTAVLVAKLIGSGQAQDLLCLGADNRWYVVANGDVANINEACIPVENLEQLSLPELTSLKLGKSRKGNEVSAIVSGQIFQYQLPVESSLEVVEQQQRVNSIQEEFERHPLQQWKNPGELIKRHKQRLLIREKLHKSQLKYQQHKSNKSYYWEDFLNLIKVLQEFGALEGYIPTPLGEAASTIRADNELWLALVMLSGELDILQPSELAAAICALITETPRNDSWCEYPTPEAVLETLGVKKRSAQKDLATSVLREIRPHLFQTQHRYNISFPIWRECELVGLVEQWALGIEWNELCDNTNLDEGDIVRMLRRTIDVLWQIPQIPGISRILRDNAKVAIAQMKRFPV